MDNWPEISHKTTADFGLLSIKVLTIANGGAIITVMNFLGKIWGDDEGKRIIPQLQESIELYILGMCAGIAVGFLSYISQSFFTHEKNHLGISFQGLAVIAALYSLYAFAFGSLAATQAFILPSA